MGAIRRGRLARDAGRWADAETEYRAALAAADPMRAPEGLRAEILGELGLAELGLEKYRDAAEHLASALSLSARAAPPNPLLQRRLEDGQRRAERHVTRLYVGVNPPDAEVLLDGKPLAERASAYQLFVDPGSHAIGARRIGYGEHTTTFDAPAGEALSFLLKLERLPQAPGEAAATAAPRWMIAVDAPRGASWPVAAGAIVTATTAVMGGAALVWADVLDGDIKDKADELRRTRKDPGACLQPDAACSDLQDAAERRDFLDRFGLISLSASGAAGVLTLALFGLTDDGPNGEDRVRVVPLTGERAGLMVMGAW